jgi:flagellar biosynthesis/type III secretory pathway M-ring protein FliF/YscJ
MEFLGKLAGQIVERFRSLSLPARLASALFGLAVVAGGILMFARSQPGRSYEPLFDGRAFSDRDLVAMTAAFQAADLPASRIVDNQIHVPRSKKQDYLVALQKADAVPPGFDDSVDQAIEASSLFASRQQSELSRQYAEQMKLARIVSGMNGIETASVQFDQVKRGGFPPTVEIRAFVAVRALGKRPLDSEEIEAIRDTVAGYKAGLDRKQVTVADLNACRTYPGSYEGYGPHGAGSAYATTKRLLESEFRSKIQRRLSMYPDVVVGVNVHLASPAASGPPPAAGTEQGHYSLVPSLVTASIDLPLRYIEQVWQDRTLDAQGPTPNKESLQQVEQELKGKIEQAVLALLPPPAPGLEKVSQVSVTSYEDPTASTAVASRAGPTATWWARTSRPLAALGLTFSTGMLAYWGWRRRSSRSPSRTPVDEESPGLPAAVAHRPIEDAGRDPQSIAAEACEEITRLVQQDPQAVARALRQWLDHAA